MDLLLNFGENYYESDPNSIWVEFLLTLIGAFLGFGFALYLYYKKQKSDRKEQNKTIQTESENVLRYHNLLIDHLIDNIQRQIESLNEYKTNQEKDFLNIIPPKQVSTNDFKRLVSINKDIFESFNYYFKENIDWIEDLKELHIYVDFIEGAFKEIFRITSNHMQVCTKNMLEIKQNIDLIPNKFTSISFNLERQFGDKRWENEEFNFVNSTINKYRELADKKASLHLINFEYLDPILNSIMNKYNNDDRYEEIIFLCKNTRVKMDDVINDVKNFIVVNEEIQATLRPSVIKLNEFKTKYVL